MASKTNTDKIDELNVISATLSARLDALLTEVRANTNDHAETSSSLAAMKTQIAVVEVHVGGIVPLKAAIETITVLEREFALLKKDLEGFSKWKDDLKREKDEATRRWWAFGPNITAAILGGIITLIGIGINVAVNHWLNKPK
ncbi:MAG TPA: hypothetical protein VH682_18820 [Gemmataceae bacterium]